MNKISIKSIKNRILIMGLIGLISSTSNFSYSLSEPQLSDPDLFPPNPSYGFKFDNPFSNAIKLYKYSRCVGRCEPRCLKNIENNPTVHLAGCMALCTEVCLQKQLHFMYTCTLRCANFQSLNFGLGIIS